MSTFYLQISRVSYLDLIDDDSIDGMPRKVTEPLQKERASNEHEQEHRILLAIGDATDRKSLTLQRVEGS